MTKTLRACLSLWLVSIAPAYAQEPPRLVLQLTVDALRGDLPTRYFENLGEGGRPEVDNPREIRGRQHWYAGEAYILVIAPD